MMEYKKIFCREVLMWRVLEAILWTIFCEALYMCTFLIILNFNPIHPITWIRYSIGTTASFSTWSWFLFLVLGIFGLGVMLSNEFLGPKPYYGTRFSVLCSTFLPSKIFVHILHLLLGGLTVRVYLSLLGGPYGSLTTSNEDGKRKIVEANFFLLLSGMWTGLCYFLYEHVLHHYQNRIKFPVIQQSKFLQIKSGILSKLKSTMHKAIYPPLCFICIYYWNGGSARDTLCSVMHWQMEDSPMDSVSGILNPVLLFYMWIFSFIILLTLYTMELIFQVYLTEHCLFPISNPVKDVDCVRLEDALSMMEFPILHYLGYLDFVVVAEKSPNRRQEVFSLSHPGGHPHNWNGIVQQCLELLNLFSIELTSSYDTEVLANLDGHPELAVKTETLPIGLLPPKRALHGMRNLVQEWGSENVAHDPQQRKQVLPRFKVSLLVDVLKDRGFLFWYWLRRKPGFSYLFSELPTARSRRLFSYSQPVIWACRGLSSLAAASFTEDHFGVLQKDLPAIISTILQLKLALDRQQKLGNSFRRSQTDYDLLMKAALRSTVKRSIYKICVVFDEYVKDLPLSKEALDQLQFFLDFKEG